MASSPRVTSVTLVPSANRFIIALMQAPRTAADIRKFRRNDLSRRLSKFDRYNF
jgi:hypothetical protein